MEEKLNREQYRFPRNSETHNYSIFGNKQNYNDTNFSTVKRIKFSNDTPISSFSRPLNWTFQKQNNFKDTLKTPASMNSNLKSSSSVVSKFTPFSSNRQNIIPSSNKSVEHSFLIKRQERIPIRENNNSNGKNICANF